MNFWNDSCQNNPCPKHHIRRKNDRLVLFDTNAHLNRLSRKDANLKLMKIPTNCDLYINDCIVDPNDWNNPINFTNPNIHVCRSFGIHPKTTAPKAFFSRTSGHLVELANQFPIGAYGPIGSTNLTDETEQSPNFEKILKDHSRIQKSSGIPIIICNMDSDQEAHQTIKKLSVNPYTPIVWQNINNHSTERFNHFVKNILPSNEQYLFTINGKCLEYKFARTIQNSLKTKEILERLLIGTDSPHYPANYYGKVYSTPLHIANIMLEIHLIISRSDAFKNFTLADTNDFFTSNAFSVFPKGLFQGLNKRCFDNFIRLRLTPTLTEYRSHIKYLQPKINKSLSTKRTTTDNIENLPPNKKLFTNTEVQTTQIPFDETFLPDISLEISNKTEEKQTPLQNDKPKQQRVLTIKENVQTIDLTTKTNEQKAETPRAKRIVDKALEIRYGDASDPESPLWRGNPETGSRIQILKIPKSLVRKMAEDAEDMDDEEFNKYLNQFQ